MSNIISKDLFSLIKSLSKSEKRYFKLYIAKQVTDKDKYVKLFDAVDKQEIYNEKLFIENIKQLSLLKNRLYNIILKSLAAFHANNTIDSRLRSMMQYIDILYKKGHYSQCKKIINNAITLAEKYDKHLYLLELLFKEIDLMSTNDYVGITNSSLSIHFNKMYERIKIFENILQYNFIHCQLFSMRARTGFVRDSQEKSKYKDIMNNKLLSKYDYALSHSAQELYYKCHSLYQYINQNYYESYLYVKKIVRNVEQYPPHLIEENLYQYIVVLNNFAVLLFYLKKYDEIEEIIQKMEELYPSIKGEKSDKYIFFLIISLKLDVCIETGQFQKGAEYIKHFLSDKLIEKYSFRKEKKILFYYESGYIYFGCGDYKNANKYMNKILNESFNTRDDLICYAKILTLIIQFESGHYDLLEYTVKSTKCLLTKKNRVYHFENIILKFFEKEIYRVMHSQKELHLSFIKLREELQKATNKSFDQRALRYFDFISWIESKIEGISFSEIVKKKASLSKIE